MDTPFPPMADYATAPHIGKPAAAGVAALHMDNQLHPVAHLHGVNKFGLFVAEECHRHEAGIFIAVLNYDCPAAPMAALALSFLCGKHEFDLSGNLHNVYCLG